MSTARPPVRGVVTLSAAAVAAAALAAAFPAQAKVPQSMLGITRHDLIADHTRHWSLFCDPDGGTHPEARRACDHLRAIDGDLGLLRARYRSARCVGGHTPVRVEIRGSWHGRIVGFHAHYPNAACAQGAAASPTLVPG
ncbi:SSI family serine proteinase inhibitor [Spongiactinospora gelatinilytica]|uniref:SSI family serine proteinase inhibitor n=1 Tax=Spongiactinospora gelatinilytica TaxID=2666298 RepID=UPI001314091A|nr:SSI family serine proteinase inhibitor [Spongiactinospora gelatinilytica]